MTVVKKGFVLGAVFLSGIATALLCFSCFTEHWIVSEGVFNAGNNDLVSTIKYGLFAGVYHRHLLSRITFELKMTCLIEKNICAYLCGSKSEYRTKELLRLYNNDNINFGANCPQIRRDNQVWYNYQVGFLDNTLGNGLGIIPQLFVPESPREFLNAGLYLSTVAFLCIAIFFGVAATFCLILNLFKKLDKVYLSLYAVYVYNSIACFGTIMTLALWGSMYTLIIIRNVGISDTITGAMTTSGMALFGYSYWILLPSTVLFGGSITLMMIRHHMIESNPLLKIYSSPSTDAREMTPFRPPTQNTYF